MQTLPIISQKWQSSKRHDSSCEALASDVRQTTQLYVEKHTSTIR